MIIAIASHRLVSTPAAEAAWSNGAATLILADLVTPPPVFAAAYEVAQVSDTGLTADAAQAMQAVAFDVPPDWQGAVDRWYAEEHIALLMRAPGWLRARRYRVLRTLRGTPYTSIALHDLADTAVMASPERAAARATPWRATMADLPWFVASGRWLFDTRLEP